MQFQQWLSVDEIIIPYNSRHECKQFIRGKPIHFAYKLQSLALSTGSMYGDPHTLLPETGLGQRPSVVLGLAEQAQVPQVIHDNLFTLLLILIALLNEISKRRYGSSGTERQNYWKDNSIVTVATNMEEKYSETSAKRWNMERCAFDKVPQTKDIN